MPFSLYCVSSTKCSTAWMGCCHVEYVPLGARFLCISRAGEAHELKITMGGKSKSNSLFQAGFYAFLCLVFFQVSLPSYYDCNIPSYRPLSFRFDLAWS